MNARSGDAALREDARDGGGVGTPRGRGVRHVRGTAHLEALPDEELTLGLDRVHGPSLARGGLPPPSGGVDTYVRLYGVVRGRSSVTLEGDGRVGEEPGDDVSRVAAFDPPA